ncbi:glia-derived nexin [Conger conger]|uniref:glia-derived nexin n=1 Tax=Conger conger TaxID=82655 RepID=UPI002A5A0213|nr:glia-derived nexin [Conger conger]
MFYGVRMGCPSVLCASVILALCHWGVPSLASTYGERGSDLGMRVFQEVVRSRPQENVALSPHGVASVLGMLLPGADGETRRQILTALRYKKSGPYKMLKRLHKGLTTKSNQDMVLIANGLFSQEGVVLEEPFVSANTANFQCHSQSLDFSHTPAAAAAINDWVKNQTKGMISSVIEPDMLDPALTRLVMVNSIFFKGLWKSRFLPENTKLRNFNPSDGVMYKVPMMSQLSVFNIGHASTPQGLKYKVIELPYHGNSISMLIALPTEDNTPVSALLPHLNTSTLQGWTKLLTQRKVRLLLPKFSVEAEVDLESPLSAVGVGDMFRQNKANFKYLSSEPLYVSKALQKAKIQVNEDGTKASAATTAILLARSSPPWVIVDRPFIFLIRHNLTGTVLFMGQINKP